MALARKAPTSDACGRYRLHLLLNRLDDGRHHVAPRYAFPVRSPPIALPRESRPPLLPAPLVVPLACSMLLDNLFPEKGFDIDNDGVDDMKAPPMAITHYLKGLLPEMVVVVVVQACLPLSALPRTTPASPASLPAGRGGETPPTACPNACSMLLPPVL